MPYQLAACQQTMMEELTWKTTTQRSFATTYAMALCSGERNQVDWKMVNKAILDRWYRRGLLKVKQLAWKRVEELRPAATDGTPLGDVLNDGIKTVIDRLEGK